MVFTYNAFDVFISPEISFEVSSAALISTLEGFNYFATMISSSTTALFFVSKGSFSATASFEFEGFHLMLMDNS